MDSLSSLSIPRIRVSRNPHAYEHLLSGSSLDHLPELTATTDAVRSDYSDVNDRDDDQDSTPKMTSTVKPLDPTETPAARLRALLALAPSSSKSTPMPLPTSQSSEYESDFEPPNAASEITHSSTKESLRDIFSRALRDPGQTPQKEKIRPRRNSIDTSEVEASPRVQRQRAQHKGNRKSLSDEEIDPAKSSEVSFPSSQAATFNILRERLVNSHTQLNDLYPSRAMHQQDAEDDDAAGLSRTTSTLPAATNTPHQSLHMSIDPHFPSQSNLLDQYSDMQRAFEGFDGDDSEASGQHYVDPPASSTPAQEKQHSSLRQTKSWHSSPQGIVQADTSDQIRGHERERNRPRTPGGRAYSSDMSRLSPQLQFPRNDSPGVGTSSSGNLLRRGSNASLRSLGETSSKGSSFGSQAEYIERVAELERERNIERERDWNKPRLSSSRPRSSLGFQPTVSTERSRTHSLVQPDSPSQFQAHRRQQPQSFSDSSRATSPATEEEEEESVHERERNWNAPRPRWTHPTPRTPSSPKPQSFETGTREETFRVGRQDSPTHRNVAGNGNQVKHRSPSPVRLKSPSSSTTPSLSPLSSRHERHIQSSSTPQIGLAFPRSPSPSTSSTRLKGKTKAVKQDLSSKSLHDSASLVCDSSKPDPHSGPSFAKKRAPLPPLELEKGVPDLKSSRSPGSITQTKTPTSKASGSIKHSGIPVRSPKKSKPSSVPTIRPKSPVLEVSHEATPSYGSKSNDYYLDRIPNESADSGDLSRERTPTMKTVHPPLLETPNHTPPRSSSPRLSSGKKDQHENHPQQKMGSVEATVSPQQVVKTSNQLLLQKTRAPPTPPIQPSQHGTEPEPASFLSTPPRRPSFNSSKIEFQTPSPPKNMPDLPGPPTSSSEESDSESGRMHKGYVHSDLTMMKTPRPPGAWASTPAPSRTAQSAPSEDIFSQEALNGRPRTPNHQLDSNFTATKTPRPPGAWDSVSATPAPRQSLHSDDPSLPENVVPEYEIGLATPVASLSKRFSLPAQTPAPPGAWTGTPLSRKSILKVRFDAASDTATTGTTSRDQLEDAADVLSEDHPRTRTPEPVTPVSPVSRRAPVQKSPGIRVLDAFGREVPARDAKHATGTPRSSGGIRVLDALGREIDSVDENTSELPLPLNRDEALVRVRQGLADLVDGLDEMDKLEQDNQVDYSRLQELQEASALARATRARVKTAMVSNESDTNRKSGHSQANPKSSRLSKFSPSARRLPAPWIIFSLLLAQLFLFIFLYRFASAQAQKAFLTTYYDPFYPDLHLYTFRPDTLRLSLHNPPGTSWFAIPSTFYREGWQALSRQVWENLLITIWDWQQILWEKLGEGAPQSTSWPPT